MTHHSDTFDAVVIGGGTAGLSAALTLGRSTRRVLVASCGPTRNARAHGAHNIFTRDGTAPGELVRIGREQLHQYDVMALMRLGPVYRGRYWMDGQGYFGVEGGPALGNLWAIARAAGRGNGGAQTTYNRDGSMFGSDGNGCLVFNDPGTRTSYTGSGC